MSSSHGPKMEYYTRGKILNFQTELQTGLYIKDKQPVDIYRAYPFLEKLIDHDLFRFFFIFTHGSIIPDAATASFSHSFVCPPNTVVIQTGADETCFLSTAVAFDTVISRTFTGPIDTLKSTLKYFTGYGQHVRDANLDTLLYTTPNEETLNKILTLYESDVNTPGPDKWGVYTYYTGYDGSVRISRDYELTDALLEKTSDGKYTEQLAVQWLVSLSDRPTACIFINCSSSYGEKESGDVRSFSLSMDVASRNTHHGAPRVPDGSAMHIETTTPVSPQEIMAAKVKASEAAKASMATFQKNAKTWTPTGIPYAYPEPVVTRTPSEEAREAQVRALRYKSGLVEPFFYGEPGDVQQVESYSLPRRTPSDEKPFPPYTAFNGMPGKGEPEFHPNAYRDHIGQEVDPSEFGDTSDLKGKGSFVPGFPQSLAGLTYGTQPQGVGAGAGPFGYGKPRTRSSDMEVDEEPKRRGGKNGRRTRRARRKHNVSSVPTPRSSRKPL